MNSSAKLPHRRIVAVCRADASGDAFIFTQFLDFSTQRWADKIGYGTSIDWPSGPLSLQHSFKLALGIGPQRYDIQRRLGRTKTLMRRTNQPLAWVAQESGFAD